MDPKLSLDPNDYEDIDIDDPDNPEWSEEDFARARPFKEVNPEMYAEMMRAKAAGEPWKVSIVSDEEDAARQGQATRKAS